ncbi:MAG: MarR family winged helix-turn-helix transcriptional regulator [Pseudomonadales bacterium]
MGKTQAKENQYAELPNRPGFLIRRLHQIHVSNFLNECHGLNITQVQFGVLNVLDGGAALDQVSLGAQLGIDRTNVADVVARLEKRGLVKRVINSADRRSKLVSITRAGRAMAKELTPAMVAAQKMLIEPLSEKEQATLIKILQKLLAAHNDRARTTFEANSITL